MARNNEYNNLYIKWKNGDIKSFNILYKLINTSLRSKCFEKKVRFEDFNELIAITWHEFFKYGLKFDPNRSSLNTYMNVILTHQIEKYWRQLKKKHDIILYIEEQKNIYE